MPNIDKGKLRSATTAVKEVQAKVADAERVGEAVAGAVKGPAKTMAAGAVTGADRVERGGGGIGDRVDGLAGAVVENIAEGGWDKLASGAINVGAGLRISNRDALGVRLSQRVYRADDPFVTENPRRRESTDRLRAKHGKEVSWVSTGGVADARMGLTHSVPVSGVVNLYGGFKVGGALEYYAIHPYETEGNPSDEDILARTRIYLPLKAQKAREFWPGTFFQFVGKGTANLSAGIYAGLYPDAKVAYGSVSSGLYASQEHAGVFKLRIDRQEGDEVKVELSEVKERRRTIDAEVDVSVTEAGYKLFVDTLEDVADVADADIDLDALFDAIPGLEDKNLAELIKEKGVEPLAKAAKSYTAFYAGLGRTAEETSADLASYRFDLSNPEARRAYEALLRLDERSAAQIAGREGSGVKRVAYHEVSESDEHHAELGFGEKKLILFRALTAERERRLEGEEVKVIRNSWYERDYKGRITGDRNIRWEGVEIATGDDEPVHFARLTLAKDDRITTDDEVLTFVRFADFLGIEDAVDRQIELPKGSLLSRIFSKDDDTRVAVDLYFTDDGLDKIADASALELQHAYVKAAEALDPALADFPLDEPEALEFYKEYKRFEDLSRQHNNAEISAAFCSMQSYVDGKYQEVYPGRSLATDYEILQEAGRLTRLVNEDRSGQGEGWHHLMQRLGEANKFDYMRPIAALAHIAGADETLIRELSMKGKGITLCSRDEGPLAQD